jgi:hypothetical protein
MIDECGEKPKRLFKFKRTKNPEARSGWSISRILSNPDDCQGNQRNEAAISLGDLPIPSSLS